MSNNGRNLSVPLVPFRRFIAMKERYSAEFGIKDMSNGDMFLAILKLAEQEPDRLGEIVRGVPKSSQG